MLINNPVITGSFTVNGTNFITNTPTTGSNTFNGNQIISGSAIVTGSLQVTGSMTATGTITAQTLVVQTVTSSVVFSSGSNIFGNSLANTQQLTGSVGVTGSFTVATTGTELQVNANGVTLGNALTDIHNATGSLRITGSLGIGTASPARTLDVTGTFRVVTPNRSFFITSNAYSISDGTLSSGIGMDGDGLYLGNVTSATGWTISNPQVTIRSSGNVGIGTGNPLALLDVCVLSSGARRLLVNYADSIVTIKSANDSNNGENLRLVGDNIIFNSSSSGNGVERMRISSGGNLLFTGGVSTGVTDTKFLMISQGTTSSTFAMVVKQSNNSTNLFLLRDDGLIQTGTASGSPYNNTSGAAANVVVNSAGTLERSTSSIKYKKDVRNYDKGLAEVLQMRPVYYKGKNPNDGDKQFAGLIAEEIHDLGLTEFVQYAEDESPDALAYQNMVALLTKAIQEQQAQIEALKTEIETLKNK